MLHTRCIKWIVLPIVMLYLYGCDRESTKKLNPLWGDAKPQVAKVVLAVSNDTTDFYKTMVHAARAHQRANSLRYELIVIAVKDQGNIPKQVQCIKDLIDQRVLVTGDPHAEQIGVEGIETALAVCSKKTGISDYLTTVSIFTDETLSLNRHTVITV